MITLATNWTTAWLMTGIGIGVVFCILVILVIILNIFQNLAKGNNEPAKVATQVAAPKQTKAQPVVNASAAEQAAVATALYLYFRDVHDTESGVITIQPTANTAWHAVLNTRF